MYRYFTISNLFSASRIFLVIPMGYCLVLDFPYHRLWTAGIIVIAVATDFLDGFLARKLHQVTDLGKIIDPLADKIGIKQSNISRLESGNYNPSLAFLKKVAKGLGKELHISFT